MYRAVRDCYHERQYYYKGDEYRGNPETMPRHFADPDESARQSAVPVEPEEETETVDSADEPVEFEEEQVEEVPEIEPEEPEPQPELGKRKRK